MVTQAHAFLCRIHCAHVLIAMLFSTVVWPRMQSLYNGWRMHGADARSVPVQHALHRLAWFQLCARRWYAPDSLPMTLQRVLADHLNGVCRFAHATVLHGCAMGPPARSHLAVRGNLSTSYRRRCRACRWLTRSGACAPSPCVQTEEDAVALALTKLRSPARLTLIVHVCAKNVVSFVLLRQERVRRCHRCCSASTCTNNGRTNPVATRTRAR